MSRLDKFLWSIRVYKTRSDAADACKSGRVNIDGVVVKASREVKPGDLIEVRKGNVRYKYRVIELLNNRVGAKLVPNYVEDLTPPEELAKLDVPKETLFVYRERGTGRPTKKERRDLDELLDF